MPSKDGTFSAPPCLLCIAAAVASSKLSNTIIHGTDVAHACPRMTGTYSPDASRHTSIAYCACTVSLRAEGCKEIAVDLGVLWRATVPYTIWNGSRDACEAGAGKSTAAFPGV